jgi:tetratricopeptide (TPR) repeat protein
VAKARGVPLADGADAVARLSPDGILDYTQIYDHCHPTPDTHLTLARTIGERVIEELRPPDPDGEPDAPAAVERELRREFEREHREDPDRVETWLGMPLVFGQASWPGDPQSADRERWIAMRASMKGAGSPAWNHLGVLAYHGFKAECSMEDVPCLQDAVDAFRRAIDLDPADPRPRANLGRVLLEAGRTREGVESLEAALALDPGDRAAVTLLARTKRWARQGG